MASFQAKCPSIARAMQAASDVAKQQGALNRNGMTWHTLLENPIGKLQSVLARKAATKSRSDLLGSMSTEDAAECRSNGGTGAGAWLQPPPEDADCKPLPDSHFRIQLRDRLLLDVCPPGALCQHRRRNGTLCLAPLDSRGHHSKKCKCQGLVEERHDQLRDYNANAWHSCTALPTNTEQVVPEWNKPDGRGGILEARLDIATSDPGTGTPLFYDVVVKTAHSDDASTLRSRATHDGRAAADGAAEKKRRYDRAGSALVPLSIEAGGRPGRDVVNFIRRCGAAWRDTHDGDTSGFGRLWYGLSTTLQLWNAELLLSSIGALRAS